MDHGPIRIVAAARRSSVGERSLSHRTAQRSTVKVWESSSPESVPSRCSVDPSIVTVSWKDWEPEPSQSEKYETTISYVPVGAAPVGQKMFSTGLEDSGGLQSEFASTSSCPPLDENGFE